MTTRFTRSAAAWAIAALAALIMMAGCAGSSGGAGAGDPGASPGMRPAAETGLKESPGFPAGKFTVQLGAYESEAGAMKIAALARTRFSRDVNTVFDAGDALYKVMLGIFDTKDEARNFRDTIVRQYPAEYRDAWVSELVK